MNTVSNKTTDYNDNDDDNDSNNDNDANNSDIEVNNPHIYINVNVLLFQILSPPKFLSDCIPITQGCIRISACLYIPHIT